MMKRSAFVNRIWRVAAVCALVSALDVPSSITMAAISERAAKYAEDARRYLERGDVRAALIQLRNAVRADPNSAELRIELAKTYLRVGDAPSAEKEFKAGRDRGAGEAATAEGLARAYLMQGKLDDLLKEFVPGDRGVETEAALAILRGYAHLGQNHPDRAEEAFREASRLRPQDARPLVGLANVSLTRRQLREGEAMIDQALTISPELADALAIKGEFRRLAGDTDRAFDYFTMAVDKDGSSTVARFGRAMILVQRDNLPQASEELRLARLVAPRHPVGQYLRAVILAREGNRKAAIELLQPLSGSLVAFPPSLFLLGALLYQDDQVEQAETNLTRYITATGGDLRSRKLLGALYLRKNAPARAIEALFPAAEAAGDDPQFYGLLASAYMRNRQNDEAAKWLDRAAQTAALDSEARLRLTLSRLQIGQTEVAEKELEAALTADPQSTQTRILLAIAQVRSGDLDDAAKTAAELRAQMPGSVIALNLSGSIEALKRNYADARSYFEEALDAQADFVPALLNLGRIDAQEADYPRASARFNAVLRTNPRSLEAMLELANLARRNNRPDEAASWLGRAATENPDALIPRAQLVEIYVHQRDSAKAMRWAKDMERIDATSPQSLYALARAQTLSGESASAVATYRRLADAAPRSAAAQHLLARALMGANDADGGYRALQRAVQVDDAYAPAFADLLEAEIKAGRVDVAARMAADWRTKRPRRALGDLFVADVAMRTGRYADAAQAYEAALTKEASSRTAIRLHEARMQLGQRDMAIGGLADWVTAHPDDLAASVTLGNAYIGAARYDVATSTYERVVEKSPTNAVALNNLAWLYDRNGDSRALAVAERAYSVAPMEPAIADTYGYLLVRRGQVDRGVKLLREAYGQAPESKEIGYHLAVGLRAAGQRQEARAILEEILASGADFQGAAEARQLLNDLGTN